MSERLLKLWQPGLLEFELGNVRKIMISDTELRNTQYLIRCYLFLLARSNKKIFLFLQFCTFSLILNFIGIPWFLHSRQTWGIKFVLNYIYIYLLFKQMFTSVSLCVGTIIFERISYLTEISKMSIFGIFENYFLKKFIIQIPISHSPEKVTQILFMEFFN